MVSEAIASNLKKELPSAQIYSGKDISSHVPKQILSMMVDTQFISNASYTDMLKVVSTLQQHGSKILWLSDGKNSSQVVGVATLSMIVGSIARDDNLNKADLIAINSRPIVVASILHNKK
jgi:cation transport ATPase